MMVRWWCFSSSQSVQSLLVPSGSAKFAGSVRPGEGGEDGEGETRGPQWGLPAQWDAAFLHRGAILLDITATSVTTTTAGLLSVLQCYQGKDLHCSDKHILIIIFIKQTNQVLFFKWKYLAKVNKTNYKEVYLQYFTRSEENMLSSPSLRLSWWLTGRDLIKWWESSAVQRRAGGCLPTTPKVINVSLLFSCCKSFFRVPLTQSG